MATDDPTPTTDADITYSVFQEGSFYIVGHVLDGGRRNGICIIPMGADPGSDKLRRAVADRLARLLTEHGMFDLNDLVGGL